MYYSVFDLLLKRAKELDMSETELYEHFQKRKFRKRTMDAFRNPGVTGTPSQQAHFLEFLGISELELHLLLGNIPEEYEKSYVHLIPQIAGMLQTENDEVQRDKAEPKPVPCYETEYGKLYNTDCMEILKHIETESIDMIFCDPPFNLDKKYDNGLSDDISTTEYIHWCRTWIDECVRVLKDGGSFFLYNLPKWNMILSDYIRTKLTIRSWIVINMRNYPISTRLNPTHYSLLYCSKGIKPKTFKMQRIPIETCPDCGKELKSYGGHRKDLNPCGITLSEVWEDISPVKNSFYKHRGANELSIKLMDRIISMSTDEGDLVLDPFSGTGTTLIVAEILDRRWIGCEIGECETAINRLKNSDRDQSAVKSIEKNVLFSSHAIKRRKMRGLWLTPEDKKPIGRPRKKDSESKIRLYEGEETDHKKLDQSRDDGPDLLAE